MTAIRNFFTAFLATRQNWGRFTVFWILIQPVLLAMALLVDNLDYGLTGLCIFVVIYMGLLIGGLYWMRKKRPDHKIMRMISITMRGKPRASILGEIAFIVVFMGIFGFGLALFIAAFGYASLLDASLTEAKLIYLQCGFWFGLFMAGSTLIDIFAPKRWRRAFNILVLLLAGYGLYKINWDDAVQPLPPLSYDTEVLKLPDEPSVPVTPEVPDP